MSFSFHAVVARGDDTKHAVHLAYVSPAFGVETNPSPMKGQEDHGTGAEAGELVDAAAAAAARIVDGLGEHWATAHISVSGHTNPEHKPRSGWANDCVQVTVTVASYAE